MCKILFDICKRKKIQLLIDLKSRNYQSSYTKCNFRSKKHFYLGLHMGDSNQPQQKYASTGENCNIQGQKMATTTILKFSPVPSYFCCGWVESSYSKGLLQSSIKALYKRGSTFSRSWLVENLDGGMCNPFFLLFSPI